MKNKTKGQLEAINQNLKEVTGIYRDAVSDSGISENEFWIWYTLIAMEGEYTQQDICCAWSLSKQTVNTIIKNMVQKEYAVLEAVPGTRNHKIIRLTENGRKYGEKIILPVADAEQRAIDRIPIEEQLACAKVLTKFIKLLKEELAADENRNIGK